jgi:hypothetical protein
MKGKRLHMAITIKANHEVYDDLRCDEYLLLGRADVDSQIDTVNIYSLCMKDAPQGQRNWASFTRTRVAAIYISLCYLNHELLNLDSHWY